MNLSIFLYAATTGACLAPNMTGRNAQLARCHTYILELLGLNNSMSCEHNHSIHSLYCSSTSSQPAPYVVMCIQITKMTKHSLHSIGLHLHNRCGPPRDTPVFAPWNCCDAGDWWNLLFIMHYWDHVCAQHSARLARAHVHTCSTVTMHISSVHKHVSSGNDVDATCRDAC